MRFPQATYSGLKSLLGKLYDDELVNEFRSTFGNTPIKSERGTVAFTHDEDIQYELEELVAYLFVHAKKQAENYADVTVTGAVITVIIILILGSPIIYSI